MYLHAQYHAVDAFTRQLLYKQRFDTPTVAVLCFCSVASCTHFVCIDKSHHMAWFLRQHAAHASYKCLRLPLQSQF